MASSLWKFRPSSLVSAVNVYTSDSSRELLEDYFGSDNKRAAKEDVKILKRPGTSKLRTLQWNIHSGEGHGTKFSHGAIQKGLLDAIREANADVVVLNEYCTEPSFLKKLKGLGYSYVECATVDYPTALATRLTVEMCGEIVLSWDRSALLAQVRTSDDELVWVIGTHLNFCHGGQRHKEMSVLVEALEEMGVLPGADVDGDSGAVQSRERVVLVGDLNQQRARDYAPDEWERIRSGIEFRGSGVDDGVAQMLAERGFICAWDSTPPPETNWETTHSPATHWSGTIVDYSYGCNVSPVTASISPSGWSDHRMTVCDWMW